MLETGAGYSSCLEEELKPRKIEYKVWTSRLCAWLKLEGVGSLMGLSKVGISPGSGRGQGASLSS